MQLSRRWALTGFAGTAAVAAFPAIAASQSGEGRIIDYEGMKALGLPDQRLSIWLPPGYDTAAHNYRVVYMHDAQNLFDPALSNFNKVWAADKAMLTHASAADADAWIIVGIWSPGADRYRQYMPAPAYRAASPELRARMDAFGNGKPIVSRAYIDWIAGVVRPWINRSFRTRTTPDDTAIIGSSMGGLISLYAFLELPDVFGRAGCVSTHWPGTAPQNLGETDDEMLAIWSGLLVSKLGAPKDRRLWFDHGDATLDAHYPPYQAAIDAQLASTDWVRGTHWESRFYPGAEHEENAWAARLPEVFDWVLG